MSQDEQRTRLYGLSSFFQGEELVTNTLAPYITAMPDDETRIFLTTQLVDEARHTVFFARFFKEVLGIDHGNLEATLAEVGKLLNPQLRYILVDSLNEVSERIRLEPARMDHLIEGVVLYHVIIEGTMALAGQRNILEIYRSQDIFPAFRGGFTAVARDESRHVVFGVKFLRDMIQRDHAHARIVQAAVDKFAAPSLEAITPAQDAIEHILADGGDPWQSPRYGLESLRKKIKVIGLSMELPTVPAVPQ
jgi:ribonucleoside-diphosphate reductase beta chain